MPTWTKEQSEAINKSGTNILVSAGAGSGKTAVLSERVLRILKEGTSIDSLLILTFTVAASKEMKARIRNKISKEESLKKELNKCDAAYIMTFDSFSLSVVKKYHYLLDLPKDIGITDESILDLKINNIIDTIFDEYFEENNEYFAKLISDYCFKDTLEIKKYILDCYHSLSLIPNKEEYLEYYLENYFNEININKKISEYVEIIKQKVISLNNYLVIFNKYDDGMNYTNLLTSLSPLFNSSTYEEIKFNSLISLPRLCKSTDEAKNIKKEMTAILKEINKLTTYASLEEMQKEIIATKNNVSVLIEILQKVIIQMNLVQKDNNIYSFTDIAKLAIKLVKEYPEVKDYYQNKFKEILIDEYQDTSDLQEIFIKEIAHNNVYMVGDIKQSIYRFRNANPEIFKDKYAEYEKLNGGLKIDLNKNFRSREEVLNNINLIFQPIMDLYLGGCNYRFKQELIFGNDLYNNEGKTINSEEMEILTYALPKNYEYSSKEIEIFKIAEDIKTKINNHFQVFSKETNCLKDITYEDFAILIDQSSNFPLYRKIFSYFQIPLSIWHDDSIKDNVDLIIIKNILNLVLLIHKKEYKEDFKYSYLALKRSYVCKTDDNTLFSIIKNHKWYQDEDYQKLLSLSDCLPHLSVYPFLEKVLEVFPFYDKLITVGDIVSHQYVLDSILSLAKSVNNLYSIEEFYEYLNKLNVGDLDLKISYPDEAQNSVKLMTIHGSKGLEFPVCYFANLSHKFNDSELKQNFLFNKTDGFVIPVMKNNLQKTLTYKIAENNYYLEEISERIRLFYVALTRAKEKMILVMPEIKKETESNDLIVDNEKRLKYRSFYDMLVSIQKEISPYIYSIDLEKLNLTKEYKRKQKINDLNLTGGQIITLLPYKYDIEFLEDKHFSKTKHELKSTLENNKLKEGLLVHQIFENLNLKNINYDNIPSKYLDYVKTFISNIKTKEIINEYHEYEFIYILDNIRYHGIIDLLLETNDNFIIYDYKLKNTLDLAYLNQLNGYKSYLKTITNKPIKVYLYSIIDGKLRSILDD